jgi:hypothetical protein
MWREIFKTVRRGMKSWGNVARMSVCMAVVTLAVVLIVWACSQ